MSNTGIYDYKAEIKTRLHQLKLEGKSLNLKKIADRASIQYTYLSKVLNDANLHLNEDQVFVIGKLLELDPKKVENLLLMRSYCASTSVDRKKYLLETLEAERTSHVVTAEVRSNNGIRALDEASYLFDPLAIIIHAALDVRAYKNDLRLLSKVLNVPWPEIKMRLILLENLEFIKIHQSFDYIEKISRRELHYGKDHPLMKMHQLAMQQFSASNLIQIKDSDKHSFLVTFSTDEEGRKKIRSMFDDFLKLVQKELKNYSDAGVYQMNFDLFRWL